MGSYFNMNFYYGGHFVNVGDEVQYVGGDYVECVDIDPDKFGFFDVEELAQIKSFYKVDRYAYCVPGMSLKNGLRYIKTDKEVMDMISCLNGEVGKIYIEGKEVVAEVGDNVGGHVVDNEDNLGACQLGEDDAIECSDALQSVNVEVGNICASDDDIECDDALQSVNVEVGFICASDEDEGESGDPDYVPDGQYETDDGMIDNDMETDDEEYNEARQNKKKYKNKKPIDQELPHIPYGNSSGNAEAAADAVDDNGKDSNDFVSQYDDSNAKVATIYTSDEDEECEVTNRCKKRYPTYDPNCDHKLDTIFKMGMKFDDAKQCKEAV